MDMGSGKRSDASIAVLPTKIAILPYDDIDDDDDDDDDDEEDNEVAWGRGTRDKEIL